MAKKNKEPVRPAWTGYWLLRRRPFSDDAWLRRWTQFKLELRLKTQR